MKNLLVLALLAGVTGGCYTQLLTNQSVSQPPVQKISYIVDTLTNDTIKVIHQIDTLLARDNRNCYWTRDMWGQPELRCDDSYYSNGWNTYNNYPWWYDHNIYSNYYGGGYYHQNSYYNPYYYNPYYYSGSTSGGGSPSNATTGNRALRRTSSSAVPREPMVSNHSLPESKQAQAEQPPPSAPTMENAPPPSAPANNSNSTNDNNNRRKPPTRDW